VRNKRERVSQTTYILVYLAQQYNIIYIRVQGWFIRRNRFAVSFADLNDFYGAYIYIFFAYNNIMYIRVYIYMHYNGGANIGVFPQSIIERVIY